MVTRCLFHLFPMRETSPRDCHRIWGASVVDVDICARHLANEHLEVEGPPWQDIEKVTTKESKTEQERLASTDMVKGAWGRSKNRYERTILYCFKCKV